MIGASAIPGVATWIARSIIERHRGRAAKRRFQDENALARRTKTRCGM
jgi:hypothetical protein